MQGRESNRESKEETNATVVITQFTLFIPHTHHEPKTKSLRRISLNNSIRTTRLIHNATNYLTFDLRPSTSPYLQMKVRLNQKIFEIADRWINLAAQEWIHIGSPHAILVEPPKHVGKLLRTWKPKRSYPISTIHKMQSIHTQSLCSITNETNQPTHSHLIHNQSRQVVTLNQCSKSSLIPNTSIGTRFNATFLPSFSEMAST